MLFACCIYTVVSKSAVVFQSENKNPNFGGSADV